MQRFSKTVVVEAYEWWPYLDEMPGVNPRPCADHKSLAVHHITEGGFAVFPGDWMVFDSDGWEPMSNHAFKREYKPYAG